MPEGPLIEDPRLRALIGKVDVRVGAAVRRARLARGLSIQQQAHTIDSASGYALKVWVHRPAGATGPLPGVVLCPDGRADAASFADTASPITADEVAREGVAALRFDPAGRGGSWGDEDLGGPEHQDEVAMLVRWLGEQPDVDADRVGVLSVGDGLAMATGAIARCGAPAAWLLDYEGPSDRHTWNLDQAVAAPAHKLDDDTWWAPREPARHVGALPCPYVRLQAEEDHARPEELRHALRMITAATAGDLPWFQINDHPRGDAPLRPWWLGPGRLRHNRAVLRKVKMLLATRRVNP